MRAFGHSGPSSAKSWAIAGVLGGAFRGPRACNNQKLSLKFTVGKLQLACRRILRCAQGRQRPMGSGCRRTKDRRSRAAGAASNNHWRRRDLVRRALSHSNAQSTQHAPVLDSRILRRLQQHAPKLPGRCPRREIVWPGLRRTHPGSRCQTRTGESHARRSSQTHTWQSEFHQRRRRWPSQDWRAQLRAYAAWE